MGGNKVQPAGAEEEAIDPSYRQHCGILFKIDGEGLFSVEQRPICGTFVPAAQGFTFAMLLGHCIWGAIVLADSAATAPVCEDALAAWGRGALVGCALTYVAVLTLPFAMRNKHNARISGCTYLLLAGLMVANFAIKFNVNAQLEANVTSENVTNSCGLLYPTTRPALWALRNATNAMAAMGTAVLFIPSIIFVGATQQKCAGI